MRMSIKDAALKLGIPDQSLRCWLQKGTCPFGEVIIDLKRKGGHRTYYINKQRLELYLQGKL